MVHGVHGNVRAGIAAAHHQNALPGQLLRRLVFAGVHHPPGKLARQFGDIRVVKRAVGDQHTVEPPGLPLAAALGGHRPGVAVRLHLHHTGIEFVAAVKIEVARVVPEIAPHLRMVWIGRHRLVHGELGELGGGLGGNQMRRLVHGAVGIVDIPQPAHVGMQFEADERDPVLVQIARRSQPHRARADNRVHRSSVVPPGRPSSPRDYWYDFYSA